MNPIYQFLKENNLTDKDEKTFEKDYSDSTKAKELYGFFQENKLTDKDFNSFYDTYLKKKEPSQVVLPTGGKAGTSEAPSGFGDLKPAKIQPIKVEVPKQLREEEVKIPKQLAGAKVTDEGQSYVSNLVSSLDRGFYKNLIGNPVKGLGTLVEMGTSAMTDGKVKEGPVSDALMRFGNWFNNAIDEVAPQDPEFKNSLSDQFGQALGQVGSLVLTGGVGAGGRGAAIVEQVIPKTATTVAGKIAAKAAPTLRGVKELTKELATPASISAGLTVGQSEFERAKEAGATDEQAFEAFYKNAAVGSVLEKIPVMQFLKRFNNATSGGVVNYLKTKGVAGITGGLEEATTEVLQQIYANKTAQDIYNINQNIFEGLTESGGIGFGVGFLLNAMGAQAKILRQQGKEQEAQTLENQEQEFKARAEGAPPPAAPPPPPAAPAVEDIPEVAPQVPATPEIEAKKADIERRRQEELKIADDKAYEESSEEFKSKYPREGTEFDHPEINAKYDAELATLGVGEEVAPQVPAAPEKTQAETAKEQTIETDLLIGGQAAQRRKDGKYTKDGVEYVRNEKGQGVASDVAGEVRFTNEVSLPFRYKLIEAETLQPSHQDGIRNPNHFIPEAQPKNRNDAGSLMAENSFASKPRFEELGENTNAYSGAPVVNERGEVIQGNNRSAGLRKGYKSGNQEYKNSLAENAEQFGFTREQVEGMKEPVLVREVAVSDEGAIEIGNYDVKDLETGGKRRLDPIAVTRRMPFDVKGRIAELLFTGEETLNQAIRANQKRVLELLNPYLNQAQRNTITKDGVLTDAGIKDLEDVVKQFLFDNGDTALPDLFENLSATQKEGLKKALPYIFSTSPDKSIVPDIQEAILAVNDFKESGAGDFDAWLSQRDMFADGATPKDKYTPLEIEIARTLVETKTQKEIAKKFGDYADLVRDKPADMFEAARPGKTRAEGIKEVFKTEDYAKPISERGRKTLAREEKPAPEPSPKAGDAARRLAERIRQGKINKLGGFRAGTGFDAVWDASLEVIAKALEGGASVADAIEQGLKYAKSTGWYKKLTNPADFDKKYREQLNEEYNAIQVGGPEEVSMGEAPRGRKEVESGVPPTRPKKPTEEGEGEGEKGERRFTKRMIESPLEKAVKKGVSATLEYTKQTNAMSVAQAQEILDVLGEDKAYNVLKDEQTNGAVRVVLGQVLIKRYNELAKKATTKEDKDLYIEATIDIAEYVTTKLATDAGQTIQAFKLWEQLTPEAQVLAAVKQIKKSARRNIDKVRKDIDNLGEKFNKANEDAVKEILKSEEVDQSVKKDTQERINKAKDKAAKARQKRADIINKYKGKGGITLTTGGLTKEGIEFVGEVALTYIEEGLAEVQAIAEKIFADIKTITGSSPNDTVKAEVLDIAEKTLAKSDIEIVKSVKDQKLKINEIAIKHFTEAEKIKKGLAQKFVEEADMSESNAEALAKRFEDAFDRVVSRKKAEILAKEKKRFERIQKAVNEQAGKKAEKKTLQDEIIKYSNLGAFNSNEMLDLLSKKFDLGQLTTEQAAKIQQLAEKIQKAPEGSPKMEATEDLLAYQADLNKGNWGEVAQGIWYANILSGYRTHEKNIISTFFNSLADLGTEVIADPKGAPYLIAGYMRGVGKIGMLEALRTLKTGRSPIHVRAVEIPDILERKQFVGEGYNPANWFKYVGRAMKAEDILSFQGLKEARAWQLARREAEKYGFNTWSKSGWKKVNELLLNTSERYEIASSQAESEGLKPNTKQWKRRIYELMESSRPEAMTEDAYNFAAHGTYNYNSDGFLGAVTNAISKVLDIKIGGVQPGRFVVPFTRIITNVVNNALDYSPVGIIRAAKGARGFKSFEEFSLTKGAYKPLTPEQRRVVSIKAAVGISFAAIIQYMVSEGLIDLSGGGPEDEKKKAQLKEQGWEPYSIKIGDKWYSYFYTPLVLTLGWMGNLNDAAKYGKEDEKTLLRRASIASLKFGGMLADMTWINSASTFLGAFVEPKIGEQQKRVENALSGMARGFVPFAQNVTQLTQAYNSTFQIPAKQVNNSWEALYQDIPIARNSLNDKINALGEPVIKDIDIMWSKEKGDPIWSYLTNKQGWVAPLNRKTVLIFDETLKQDRPLTDDEFYKLSKLRGSLIKKDIERIMKEGYPVLRNGAIVMVAGEDLTSAELNNILSRRIEPLATKKAKAEIFGEGYSEMEKDEMKKELSELEREYWGLVD